MKAKQILSSAAIALLLASCQEGIDYQGIRDSEYLSEFIKTFGIPDPDHSYNMIGTATANVSVANPTVQKVRLLTAFPGNDNSRLLAEKNVTSKTFTFDLHQGTQSVYVQLLDANVNVVSGSYAPVQNGQLKVTDTARSRATIGIAELGDDITSQISNNAQTYDEQGKVRDDLLYKVCKLSGDYSRTSNDLFTMGDILKLVGPGAVFEESFFENGKCILERYADSFKVTDGVELTTLSETEVVINYIYGNTAKKNTFGYFYYPDGASNEDIAKATKYVLIDDATPTDYNKYGSNGLSSVVQTIMSNETSDHKLNTEYLNNNSINLNDNITTTEFQLTYFDADGTPHDKFPANYRIAFFLIMGGNGLLCEVSNWENNVRFSLVWMNNQLPSWMKHEQCGIGGSHSHDGVSPTSCSFASNRPIINFITYQWGDKTLVGIEDEGGDDDMNDLVFFVSGDFDKTKLTKLTDDGSMIRPSGCMLAVEDLGASFDWDFNDMVVGVCAEDDGNGGKTVTIDPLAAGGTLPIRLMYTQGDKKYFVGPEFHSWFGVSTTTMHNTGAKAAQPTRSLSFTAPESFSMAPNTGLQSNMGGFWVLVDKSNAYSSYNQFELMEAPEDIEGTIIPAPVNMDKDANTAIPYMLCLGEEWHWAREQKHLNEAYGGGFASWVQDKSYNWYDTDHTNTIYLNMITLKPGDTSSASVIGPVR